MDKKEILQKQKDFLFGVLNYYEEPLVLTEGKGLYVQDIDGKRYLDFFGGILTVSIGHADDGINAQVKAQLDRLGHVSTLYPTLPIVELAEKLARLTPGELKKCFFTNSGTEADETAVMMAQVFTGNQEVIALRHGYSGRSILAQSLTAHSNWRAVPSQVAAVKHALNPYCYRCPLGLTYPSCKVKCASDIEDLIRTTTTGRIAGFLAEPIQGVGGFITPPKEYFEMATKIVRKYGGVFICDEIQTGLGRTGEKWWGIEHWNVEPEIMTMAKGVANGLPMGVTVVTPAIGDSLKALTLATFGGNPISCASANATVDKIEKENLPMHVQKMGEVLRLGLEKLQKRFPKVIGDVRGMGLMQAMELVEDETIQDRTPNPKAAMRLFEETRKRGLLIGKGALHGNVIRISPPMTVNKDQIAEALKALNESFEAMGG